MIPLDKILPDHLCTDKRIFDLPNIMGYIRPRCVGYYLSHKIGENVGRTWWIMMWFANTRRFPRMNERYWTKL